MPYMETILDLTPFTITPTDEPVSIGFTTDFAIEIAFRDSSTGEIILDLTGDKKILMSSLLGMMTVEALHAFVEGVAPQMVALAEGI